MQDYIGSPPQLERGALGSAVIAGGVQMKLLAIWFCGNRSMAKGVSEDRLAHLSINWIRQEVPIDSLPAVMDDRVGWRKRDRGSRLRST